LADGAHWTLDGKEDSIFMNKGDLMRRGLICSILVLTLGTVFFPGEGQVDYLGHQIKGEYVIGRP